MITALFIGRFQPFHLGHLSAIKQIKADKIIIGIGSSQYSNTNKNPFDFETRKKMIELSLENELKIPYKIFAIPDIHDEKKWVEYVVKIIGSFDVVYSSNDWVKKLFEEKGYEVKPVDIEVKITATEIRKMVGSDDEGWKKYVPKTIRNLLTKDKEIGDIFFVSLSPISLSPILNIYARTHQ